MLKANCPEMSVITVTPSGYDVIRNTLECLRLQTARRQLELIIVVPSKKNLDLDPSFTSDFFGVQLVEVGTIQSTGHAIACGIHRASAPIVAYAEEHSYPQPEWAEALIQAHQKPCAAVGAKIINHNPESIVSWTNIVTDFGPWGLYARQGEMPRLPSHHTSYKRELLLTYGSKLGNLLEAESVLQGDLIAKGYKLFWEPRAEAHHVQMSQFSSYLKGELCGGRLYGAIRAEFGHWSVWKRLLYIAGSVLIPFVRLWRLRHEMKSHPMPNLNFLSLWGRVFLGLVMHTVGEVLGYAVGSGDAALQRVSYELDRFQHVREEDKTLQNLNVSVPSSV